jgi:FkbM family methyltransferase
VIARRALQRLVGVLPGPFLRWLGRVQFRVPLLRRLLTRAYGGIVQGELTIQRGPARGLMIDAAGAHPGYALGTSEPLLQQALVDMLAPGDVYYDLGANVGFFTLLAARLVGPTGAVVAFEPDPHNARTLRANVARNGLGHVTVVEQGVADTSGTLRFNVQDSTMSRLAEEGEDGIEVPVTTLDDFLAGGAVRRPTLVKLDIEGAEVGALRGATQLLADDAPEIICEVHGTEAEVREILAAAGYSLRLLEAAGEGDGEAWNPHVVAVRAAQPSPAG